MKQKDILLIVVIAIVATVASVIVSKVLFVTPSNRQQQVEVVEPISTTFTQPSTAYFNANSVNPTQTIQIGTNNNATPFKGSGQ